MNIIESVTTCLSKYFVFKGVASRSEFWFFILFYMLMLFLGITLDGNWDYYNNQDLFDFEQDFYAPGAFWEVLISVILFLPGITVSARRLHDIGKSGWWQLIYFTGIGIIVLIFWWCKEGETTKKETHEEDNMPSLEKETHEEDNMPSLEKETYKEINISSADELKKWAELRDTGAITEEEYQIKKEELLK